MKILETYNEKFNVINQSKVRKFPTYGETRDEVGKSYRDSTDFYAMYHTSKHNRGKYLNTWFNGQIAKNKDIIYRDEKWILKEVDEHTASHLYHEKFNPISITISCPTGARFKKDQNGNNLYQMVARIHSIDDSSYGIWFDNKTFEELEEIRFEMMKWINQYKIINGDEFLEHAISLGADKDSIDYN